MLDRNNYDGTWLARMIGCDERAIDLLAAVYSDPISLLRTPIVRYEGLEKVEYYHTVSAHDCLSALAFVLAQHNHEQRVAQTGNSKRSRIHSCNILRTIVCRSRR